MPSIIMLLKQESKGVRSRERESRVESEWSRSLFYDADSHRHFEERQIPYHEFSGGDGSHSFGSSGHSPLPPHSNIIFPNIPFQNIPLLEGAFFVFLLLSIFLCIFTGLQNEMSEKKRPFQSSQPSFTHFTSISSRSRCSPSSSFSSQIGKKGTL